MSIQHSSRSTIVFNIIKGKISSILGYGIVVMIGLALLGMSVDDVKDDVDATIVIFLLVFAAIAILLIIYGIKTKRRIKRFKQYIKIISLENQNSVALEKISSSTSQSIDFVMQDLKKMIYKRFFVNAYIDKGSKEIVLKKRNSMATMNKNNTTSKTPVEIVAVTCKGCGATNNVQKGIASECEFCGSALSV